MAKATEGKVYVPKKRPQRERKVLEFQDEAEAQDYIQAQADCCVSAVGLQKWGRNAKTRLIKLGAEHGITLTMESLDPNKPEGSG